MMLRFKSTSKITCTSYLHQPGFGKMLTSPRFWQNVNTAIVLQNVDTTRVLAKCGRHLGFAQMWVLANVDTTGILAKCGNHPDFAKCKYHLGFG